MDKTIVFQTKLLCTLNLFFIIIPNSSLCMRAQRAAIAKELNQTRSIKLISNQLKSSFGFSKHYLLQNLPSKTLNDPSGNENEDIYLNILQLMRKYGYSPERHEVKTKDGYILTMYRIPSNGSQVFLMHGLLCSADDWVTPGPESGIAYLLANQGYDVWLGNARGNKHSRKHEKLSPEAPEFWNFSWDEIGRYDLPAMIDYVLNTTGRTQLKYIGHSQGTTAFFVMCSERPEYNEKISLMVALSAVAWMSHLKSPLVKLISPLNPFLSSTLESVGIYEFTPSSALMKDIVRIFCGDESLAMKFCTNILFLLCGYDKPQLNISNLPVLFAHVPSGAATKQLVHYGQEVVAGRFQKFDYGENKNTEVYGLKKPPVYPVGKITAPVAIFYSKEDWLASVIDVEILKSKLSNVVEYYEVPFEHFNHMDFMWAKDVKKLIVGKLLQLLEMF